MNNVKSKVIEFRKIGLSYSEIMKKIDYKASKSSISVWCRGIILNDSQKERLMRKIEDSLVEARQKSLITKQDKYSKLIEQLNDENAGNIKAMFKSKYLSKLALALLYMAEGGKNRPGALYFGNSDSKIINLFLSLLRSAYAIDESKFRCTVQARADQDEATLINFWANSTKIAKAQFYKTRFDKRTIGIPTNKLSYMGVLRIDYFSARIYHELTIIGNLILKNLGP